MWQCRTQHPRGWQLPSRSWGGPPHQSIPTTSPAVTQPSGRRKAPPLITVNLLQGQRWPPHHPPQDPMASCRQVCQAQASSTMGLLPPRSHHRASTNPRDQPEGPWVRALCPRGSSESGACPAVPGPVCTRPAPLPRSAAHTGSASSPRPNLPAAPAPRLPHTVRPQSSAPKARG